MMSFKYKFKGLTGLLCGGVIVASVLTACSEWDDHFDGNTSITASQRETLWQNLEKNDSLSQFVALLKRTGYDKKLGASQTYTVWAPVDGSFDYAQLSSYTDDRLTKEFVENHIARNNYPASGVVDKSIYMLNEKKMHFGGSSTYDIQGISVELPNLSSSNGTIHIINGSLPFMPSIYESLSNYDLSLDSISDFIHSYDEKKIDEDKSKKGPVLNGEQTYLDTVYYEHNDLFKFYDAYINREDSNYTMLLPTNEAWHKALTTIRQYCRYAPTFDSYTDVVAKKTEKISLKDAEAMTDSVAKMSLMASLLYNNNIYDNKKLKTLAEGTTLQCDSLVSTNSAKMYSEDAASLFANAHRIDKSNGAIWVTDSLCMPTWTLWNPEIRIEAERSYCWAGYNNVSDSPELRSVDRQNEEVLGSVSNNLYIEVVPQSSAVNPEIHFYLPDVCSAEYCVYVVFVPANVNSKNYSGVLKKNSIDVMISYADENGKIQEETFKDIKTNVDSLQEVPGMTAKIDTTYVGNITFPTSYLGLSSSSSQIYSPYMRIRSRVSNRETSIYDRTLRIDCLILRPKALDDYIKAHPDYKYDRGLY